MAKKKIKKVAVSFTFAKIVIVVLVVVIVGLVGRSVTTYQNYQVLGTSTLLAYEDEDSEEDERENEDKLESKSPEEKKAEEKSNLEAAKSESFSESTVVLCKGPDGKKFETKRKDCEELNKASGKTPEFKPLPEKQKKEFKKVEKVEKIEKKEEIRLRISKAPEIEKEFEDHTTSVKTKIKIKEDEEETEVELSDDEKIHTKSKDGNTRIDITSGGVKTRLEMKDDRVVIKAEHEDGSEVELEDEALAEIEDRLSKSNIKVSTAGAEKFLVQKGTAGAVTKYPVSVDLATNKVYIDTPNGQKPLTVLPEEALQSLMAAKIVTRLEGKAVADEIAGNNLTSVNQLVTLSDRNGIPVYEINGVSDQKLFGFFSVKIEKEIVLSAETGNAVSIDQSFGDKILDVFSF